MKWLHLKKRCKRISARPRSRYATYFDITETGCNQPFPVDHSPCRELKTKGFHSWNHDSHACTAVNAERSILSLSLSLPLLLSCSLSMRERLWALYNARSWYTHKMNTGWYKFDISSFAFFLHLYICLFLCIGNGNITFIVFIIWCLMKCQERIINFLAS